MRLLALVALFAAVGCNTRQRVAGVGAGMSFVGLTLTYSDDSRTENDLGTQYKAGVTLLLTGLAVLFVAAALDEIASKEKSAPKQRRPQALVSTARGDTPEIRAMKKRAEAWSHTKVAQQAARDGDCTKVAELSAKVGTIDAEFYADVFMKDIAIQRCFVPTEPKPAVPLPPIPPTTPL
jgi:hypothetical protein